MATVKISDLPEITHLNLDTTQTIIPVVDISTDETAQITVRTLAEGLFHSDSLKVGENEILLANTIAQFSGNSETFLQTNLQNLNANGSADYVVTADIGTNANNFIDVGLNNSNYDDPDYSSMKPLDGYLYTYGSLDDSADGNLVIGTASAGANVLFIAGGTTTQNVIAKITKFGITLNNASRLEFTDGSIQTVAAAPANYTQSAFDTANTSIALQAGINATQNSQISILQSVNLAQNTNITAVNNFAAAAFTKANNALANTSGTFAGDLTVTGNTIFLNNIDIVNSNFNPNTALVQITGSNNGVTVAPSNTNYMLHVTGKANSVTRVVLDSFGANTYALLSGRMGRGSAAAPAAVANNDVMMRIVGNGYTGTNFPASSPTKIDFVASENFSNTNRGTRIEFWNTAIGSNTIQKIASFNANAAEFTGSIIPEKGFVYTPRILTGPQTTLTVDFSTDAIVKASLDNNLTVSFSNYTYGKIVEVWLTNTSGSNRTVTHGCSATNSSDNSTTFTIPATSSAYLRYFSLDGDLANTFVTSVHA